MALKYLGGDKIFGLDTDTKPVDTVLNGYTFFEWSISNSEIKVYLFYNQWHLLKIYKIDDSGTGAEDLWSAMKIISELSNKVDKIAGKGLSTEDFTTALKDKLDGLEGSKFVGQYTSPANLEAAHPTAAVGSYAYVDEGVGEPVQKYIWDSNDEEWAGPLTTSDLTPAQVKSLYEQNADTNAFTDDEKTDLAANTAARHTQGTDQALDEGGANEVTAAELRTFLDNPPGGDPGGADTNIQFNDNEDFGGSADFIYNDTTKVRTLTGYQKVKESAAATPSVAHNEGVDYIETEEVGGEEIVKHIRKRGDGIEVILSSYKHTI